MSLQARLSKDDPRLYSANRDVAHNFKAVVEKMAERLEAGQWEALTRYLADHGVTSDQVGDGMVAFITFVASATQDPKESMAQALERCGWFALPAPVRVSLMATLGTVMTGVYYHGAKEATLGGEGPCADVQALVETGARCSRLMTWPRWMRPLVRLGLRLKEAFYALRGR